MSRGVVKVRRLCGADGAVGAWGKAFHSGSPAFRGALAALAHLSIAD